MTEMGRVLHLIPTLQGGGAERRLAHLASGLRELGWEVHAAFWRFGANLERLQANGAVLHPFPARGNYDPRLPWWTWRTVRRVRPRLIQTWLTPMDLLGGPVALLHRIPWVLTEISSGPAYEPVLRTRLRIRLAAHAAGILANSAMGCRYWRTWLGDRVPGYVVRNGLPLEELAAVQALGPEESGLPPDQKLVLFAGRLAPQKNLENMLVAFREVLQRQPATLVVCGEGYQRPEVERWVRETGLAAHVRLLGYLPEQQLWRWMKRADVFVSVSFYEGMPNAVQEAMACGCPVVVSDIPEHREFLDEANARLAPPRAPGLIAAALCEVLADPAAARVRAERARQKALQWTILNMARGYDQVYRDVLARTQGGGRQLGTG